MAREISTDSLPRFIPSGVEEVQSRGVLIFIFGFALGILVSSFIFLAPLWSVFAIFLGLVSLMVDKVWNAKIGKEVLFLSLVFIALGLGALRYSIKDFHEPLTPSSQGVVVSEPEQRENTTRFVLKTDNGEKVLVNTDLYSHVEYGDRIEASGKLAKPGIIVGEDGGRPFDYAKYLSKDDIYHILSFAKVEILSSGHGNPIKRTLFKIKKSFVSRVKKILVEPESSLLAGLIVSGREAMPKDILEEFRRAGVIHIVVLSGYNVAIIAEFMRKIFENLFLLFRPSTNPRVAAGASVFGIIFFVLMTGAEATVVRASLMVLTVIVAKMFGRAYSAPRTLLVAGFIMLLQNPKILVFDPSFQLSFLATLALIYVVPIVERYLKRVPERWGLRTTVSTTIATQATVLPLLVYSVGDFSIVSLPANVLILLIIPATMLVGFTAALLAYASSLVALPLTYITHLLLSWILGVSHYLGNLSFASIAVPYVSIWSVVLIYIVVAIVIWRFQNSSQRFASLS